MNATTFGDVYDAALANVPNGMFVRISDFSGREFKYGQAGGKVSEFRSTGCARAKIQPLFSQSPYVCVRVAARGMQRVYSMRERGLRRCDVDTVRIARAAKHATSGRYVFAKRTETLLHRK